MAYSHSNRGAIRASLWSRYVAVQGGRLSCVVGPSVVSTGMFVLEMGVCEIARMVLDSVLWFDRSGCVHILLLSIVWFYLVCCVEGFECLSIYYGRILETRKMEKGAQKVSGYKECFPCPVDEGIWGEYMYSSIHS